MVIRGMVYYCYTNIINSKCQTYVAVPNRITRRSFQVLCRFVLFSFLHLGRFASDLGSAQFAQACVLDGEFEGMICDQQFTWAVCFPTKNSHLNR